MVETIEHLRARLDQHGAGCRDADFIVSLVASFEKHPWLMPLSLLAISEAADRSGAKIAGTLMRAACKMLLDEIERSTA